MAALEDLVDSFNDAVDETIDRLQEARDRDCVAVKDAVSEFRAQLEIFILVSDGPIRPRHTTTTTMTFVEEPPVSVPPWVPPPPLP